MATKIWRGRFSKDETSNQQTLREMSAQDCEAVAGGRINIRSENLHSLIKSPDGDPMAVYVDGVLQNSVVDGFARYYGSR